MSAAIDQRIVVWKYSFDEKSLRLELESISSYVSSIADISSFCVSILL